MKRTLVVLCLMAATSSALASAVSHVHIRGATITLVDLDTADGIAPSITLLHGSQPYLNMGAGSFDPSYGSDAYAALGTGADSTLSGVATTVHAQASATITGQASLVGYSAAILHGSAQSTPVGYGEYGATAAPYTSMNVQVSANTKVTVTFDASIDVATTVGMDGHGTGERAMGRILMAFDGLDAQGDYVLDQQWQELVAGYQLGSAGEPLGESLHWDGALSVSFANWTQGDSIATLYTEGVIGGSSVISAVPEPAAFGMLLGGLALLGVAGTMGTERRRAGSLR
jgi:hypothetical protein